MKQLEKKLFPETIAVARWKACRHRTYRAAIDPRRYQTIEHQVAKTIRRTQPESSIMITQNFFLLSLVLMSICPCAFEARRYTPNMQDAKQLPQEIGTAHQVILVQSSTSVKLTDEVSELKKEREELLGELRFLKSGKKRELFINSDQMLLGFTEDKELQAALEQMEGEST
jgi:septal ring factor EnvC (AmiA/AmiB activator)